MKRIVIAAALLTTVSAAAQTGPKYAPIVIDEPTYTELMKYLGDQPNKFSGPLANYLTGLEQAAVIAAAKAEAEAKAKPVSGAAAAPEAAPN